MWSFRVGNQGTVTRTAISGALKRSMASASAARQMLSWEYPEPPALIGLSWTTVEND
jgi:hypothetical protein